MTKIIRSGPWCHNTSGKRRRSKKNQTMHVEKNFHSVICLPFWRLREADNPFSSKEHFSLSQIRLFPPLYDLALQVLCNFSRNKETVRNPHTSSWITHKESNFTSSQSSRSELWFPPFASQRRRGVTMKKYVDASTILSRPSRSVEGKQRRKTFLVNLILLTFFFYFRPSFFTREASRRDWDGSVEIISYQASRFLFSPSLYSVSSCRASASLR